MCYLGSATLMFLLMILHATLLKESLPEHVRRGPQRGRPTRRAAFVRQHLLALVKKARVGDYA